MLRKQNYCEKRNGIMTELCSPLAGKLLCGVLDAVKDEKSGGWMQESLAIIATRGTSSSLNLCQTQEDSIIIHTVLFKGKHAQWYQTMHLQAVDTRI